MAVSSPELVRCPECNAPTEDLDQHVCEHDYMYCECLDCLDEREQAHGDAEFHRLHDEGRI